MYRKEMETKIIRTTHVVGFWANEARPFGTSAGDLKKYLDKVPDDARIRCVLAEVANADYEMVFEKEEPEVA